MDFFVDGSDGGFESILIIVLRPWTSVLLNRTTGSQKHKCTTENSLSKHTVVPTDLTLTYSSRAAGKCCH